MTPIQLDLVRTFGPKELSEGCLIKRNKYNEYCKVIYVPDENIISYSTLDECIIHLPPKRYEILGHIPELHDLYRIAQSKNWYITVHNRRLIIDKESDKPVIMGSSYDILLDISYKPELKLIDQSEDTLTQLLNLFK